MKKKLYFIVLVMLFSVSPNTMANNHFCNLNWTINQNNNATIIFRNKSDYSMVLKIMYSRGGLFQTITLSPKSFRTVSFNKSGNFKLKIKATRYGQSSYHDGGAFSVTCNEREWTEGEMSFQMSSYGNGLGPSISAKEFESNQ